MINYLHSLFHDPKKGWDPIPPEYAASNSNLEWTQGIDESLLDLIDCWVGGLAGKRVLDLGGGPGHYSVAFAKRSAIVTWHDVSNAYRKIAQGKAAEHNVRIQFTIGYMDRAPEMHREPFDVVFNRICWYYGFSDRSFANVIFDLLKPGGVGYVDTMHSGVRDANWSWTVGVRTWLNDRLAIKIGHPLPPHDRIAQTFMKMPIQKIVTDYSTPASDRVLFIKK